MADPELAQLTDLASNLATAARELGEATRELKEHASANTSASTITIHAGNLTSAFAVVTAVCTLLMFGLFAVWVIVTNTAHKTDVQQAIADANDREQAWLAVMQREVAKAKQQ